MACVDLLSFIYNHEFSDTIKNTVFSQSRSKEFWLPDNDGLDVMHHAVLADNHEVVSLLNERLTETSDEILETKLCSGYLHLAAVLGNERIVSTLCEGSFINISGNSYTVKWPHVDVIQRCLIRGGIQRGENDGNVEDILRLFQKVMKCPLTDDPLLSVIDIAALGNHIECVRAILKSSVVHYAVKCSTLLERALELGSIAAFHLLLKHNPDSNEVFSTFQTALSKKQLMFVAALLDHGLDVADALDGINPYHFLYLISSAFGRQRLTTINSRHVSGVDALTALLIERGFDVNACDPPGTLPLYSLLASIIQEKDYNPSVIPVGHIRSLQLLLKAGATTDVDEIQMARAMNIEPASLSAEAGRELASSALSAYIYGLQGSDTWRPHIAEHLDRICLSLLEHGANASAVQMDNGSTALHNLMHATATQHAQGHMHADLSTMSRMLLYFGADPNVKNTEGQYPVEIYFVVLLRLMGGLIAYRRWKASNNASQVIHVLYFMDPDEASIVRRRILKMLSSSLSDGVPSDVVQFVEVLMDTYVCTIKSLQELAKLALWKAVQRRMTVIRQIHMPKAFVTGIADLFNLDV